MPSCAAHGEHRPTPSAFHEADCIPSRPVFHSVPNVSALAQIVTKCECRLLCSAELPAQEVLARRMTGPRSYRDQAETAALPKKTNNPVSPHNVSARPRPQLASRP